MNTQTHYHSKTDLFIDIAACNWCRGTTHVVSTNGDEDGLVIPAWGEDKLPASPIEVKGKPCCTACNGTVYYVTKIKSQHTVVQRPTDSVVKSYKAGKAAKEEAERHCTRLNTKFIDNISGITPPEDKKQLTSKGEDSKLDTDIVIRLTSTLSSEFQRGSHIAIPADKFLEFLTTNGARTMAKAASTERKTAKELIRGLIVKKKTDEQILEEVEKQFPDSNADKKHCTKYRRELLVEGEIEADLAAVGSKEHQTWGKDNIAAAKRGPHKEFWKDFVVREKEKAAAEKAAKKEKAAAKRAKPVKKVKAKAAEVEEDDNVLA